MPSFWVMGCLVPELCLASSARRTEKSGTIHEMKNERNTTDETLSTLTVLGEPCSKANSRQIVQIAGKLRVIKSKKARNYVKTATLQIPTREPLFECDLFIAMKVYYRTRRPDLDESLVLDILQDSIYKNDRQIKGKYIEWGLDKENPRVVISCGPLDEKDRVIETLEALLEEESNEGRSDG